MAGRTQKSDSKRKAMRLMEIQSDLKKAYEASVTASWAMIVVLVLCPIAVEIVRMFNASFTGFAPQAAARIKDFVYGLAILLPLCIRTIRKAILKRSRFSDGENLTGKLRTASTITLLVAEMPAILGLLLFLMGGFYREFYIALAYSVLVVVAYFPRYRHGGKPLAF